MKLDNMIILLNELLTETSNVSVAYDIIKNYNENDWTEYITETTSYNKNLIYRNNIYEIFLISWSEDVSTKLHNHPMNGCILKILSGQLVESIVSSDKILNTGDISHIT